MKKNLTLKILGVCLPLLQGFGITPLQAQNTTGIVSGKCYTINRFGNQNAFVKQNKQNGLATGAYNTGEMCFWKFTATGKPDCYYIQNASSGLYLQSSKLNADATIQLGSKQVEYKVAQDNHPGVSTHGYYYLCSTDQNIDNTKAGTKGLNYSANKNTVVAYDIISGTNGNSYWEVKLMPEGVKPPETPSDKPFEGDSSKYYTFSCASSATTLMAENNAGKLSTSSYDIHTKVFWKLIPAEGKDCYYIKNATSGRYIQSSKQTLSSQIPMGEQPVAFKIGKDTKKGASTYGYFYLCSNDQQNIPDGAIGLNYDKGNTKNIVAWYAKSGDMNSYWSISETAYEYEPNLVPSHPQFDNVASMTWVSLKGGEQKFLSFENKTLKISKEQNSNNAAWGFIGTSNENEGYLIISLNQPELALTVKDGTYQMAAYGEATRWYVAGQKDGSLKFLPFEQKDNEKACLTVDGVSSFSLADFRSPYARATQIYSLPCGNATGAFLSSLQIAGDQVLHELHYEASQKPQSYYTIYTHQKPTVAQGTTFPVQLTVKDDGEDSQTWLYFDWNRDGVFETAQQVSASQTEVQVPLEAVTGKSRMRVRITDNGLTDAEDDVTGATYDFILNIEKARDNRQISVKENGKNRGKAYISMENQKKEEAVVAAGSEVTVVAEPQNGTDFLCWMDGKMILSEDKNYTFEATQDVCLTACFSPLDEFATGIQNSTLEKTTLTYELQQENGMLEVVTDTPLKAVMVYATNGSLVKKSSHKRISLNGLQIGTYIVKVITEKGNGAQKISLK